MHKGIENLFDKIISENLPNLSKNRDIKIQESQFQIYLTQKTSPRHIIVKLSKATH